MACTPWYLEQTIYEGWQANGFFAALQYCMEDGILNTPRIYDFYTDTLVEQRSFDSLDTCEDKCLTN